MDSITISSSASVTNTGNAYEALLPVPPSPTTPQPSADAGNGSGTAQPTEADPLPPASKRSKKCSSNVWDHFEKSEITKKGPDGKVITELWAKCNRCIYKARSESNRGTSVFWKHLAHKHQIKNGQQLLTLKKDEGVSDVAAVETYRYDESDSLKKFYLAIIMHEYPFNIVEHEFFVEFIKSLRPSFPIKSRISVRKDILNMYVEEKKRLYEHLKTLSCRFSITMDMWTSNQNKGYMCITVHWIDNNWSMQKRIIKFMHVEGHHSGKNLCAQFYDSMVDWNLDRRLLALTLDNASANDVCAKGVIQKLKQSPLICDGMFFHVRCLNHILNLVAQDGLKQIAPAIANIRNTIVIVKNSTLQWEEFMKCASECDLDTKNGLSLDVSTRWNSTYLMLKQAVYYRHAFDRLFLRHRSKYVTCAPTDQNWVMAKSLCVCLKRFYDATELFSSTSYPTANLFFSHFCKIKLAIEDWCYSPDPVVAVMASCMKLKYDKYWEKSNRALAVACFLDPRYKTKLLHYFRDKIYHGNATEEINKLVSTINQLFIAYMANPPEVSVNTCPGQQNDVSQTDKKDQVEDSDDDMDADLERYLHASTASEQCIKTELELYMEQPLVQWITKNKKEFDILSWWKVKQHEFPILSRLARDVLSIQVSTVASESAFSAGGRVVDPFRSRLDPEIVQALICTKDWTAASRKGGIIGGGSLISEMDMESIERYFANFMTTEQKNMDDFEEENGLDDMEE